VIGFSFIYLFFPMEAMELPPSNLLYPLIRDIQGSGCYTRSGEITKNTHSET